VVDRSPHDRLRRSLRAAASHDRPVVEPVARRGRAAGRWTVKAIVAASILPNIDHPSGDDPVAEDANSPVIQRRPVPDWIRVLEKRQLFVQADTSIHADFH